LGAQFAAKVGCGHAPDVATCLRSVPVNTLLAKGGQFVNPFTGGVIGPIANGTTLPVSAAEAFKLGRVNKVKLMIGVGRDEFNGGVYTNVVKPVVANTAAQYRQLVRQQFKSLAQTVMRLYPISRYPSPAPFIAYRTIMADAFSVCPALVSDQRVAKFIPVYAYQDDDADEPVPGGSTQPLGAFHSGTNHLVHFPLGSLDPNQSALQDQVLREWTGFARTGQPNVRNTPFWARYTAPGGPVMSLMPAGDSTLVPTSTIRAQHNCGFWDVVNRTAPWAP
jgi:para-nitrobenzyl esterase